MVDICFKFKINLNNEIIAKYLENNSGWELIRKQLIPNTFKGMFTENKTVDTFTKFTVVQPTKKEMLASPEFKDMSKKCEKLIKEYFSVVNKYEQNQGILWPDNFLKKTKPLARGSISTFLRKFSFLKNHIDEINDEMVNEDLRNLSQYGHGRSAILLYKKVLEALKNFDDSNKPTWFFIYNAEDETILIPEEYGVSMVKDLSESLEDAVNSFERSNLGKINILPLYSEIEFKKIRKSSAIKITYVYPNGPKQSSDVNEILTFKKEMQGANAAEKTVEYVPVKESSLDGDKIQEETKVYAKKGYFKDAIVGKTSIVKGSFQKAFGKIGLF